MTTEIIAHRGYWQKEGSAQNTLSSLRNAAELGVYGSEFDVHLTRDDVPVISHDEAIAGIHLQQVLYGELKDIVLQNGEKLPTLDEYLAAGKRLPIRMILEIKSHASPERNRKAARIVFDAVRRHGMADRIDYITFDVDAGREIRLLHTGGNVAYLGEEYTPARLKEMGFNGIDFQKDLMEDHPEYFSEAKKCGMTINIWTVNNEEEIRLFAERGADFITTDIPGAAKLVLGR